MTTSYKACHKIVFHFLCHCITDFFLPIDIQLVLFVINLNGNDGVFNMPYYDLLVGMDLTVFPSYYEPWG